MRIWGHGIVGRRDTNPLSDTADEVIQETGFS